MMCIELLENGKTGKVQRNIDLTVISYLTYPLVTKKNVTFETVQIVMETAKEIVLSKLQHNVLESFICWHFFPLLSRPMLYLEFYKTSSLSKINTESCNGEEIFNMKLFIAQDAVHYSIQQ